MQREWIKSSEEDTAKTAVGAYEATQTLPVLPENAGEGEWRKRSRSG
jgi:hypothetical protein